MEHGTDSPRSQAVSTDAHDPAALSNALAERLRNGAAWLRLAADELDAGDATRAARMVELALQLVGDAPGRIRQSSL